MFRFMRTIAVALLLVLGMAAAAQALPLPDRRNAVAERGPLAAFWTWLTSVSPGLASIWEREGSQMDPNGQPRLDEEGSMDPNGETVDEGSQMDPNGG